jgi:tetratricopeptide (TPR) repeat protein
MPEDNVFIRRHELLACLFLTAVTLAVFWQVQTHDFLSYDDPLYVTDNRQVQAGLTISGVAWAFTTGHASNWHPVTWLSHMLDCELFGVSSGPHHLTNVLFHVANTIIVFIVLIRMTGAFWRSAVVGALFSLHPLHVESVAWIAERKDVLSTFFWFLTMGAYLLYVKKPTVVRYGIMTLLFSLGLMAKPMLVTLPFVLLLLDYWPLRRFQGELTQKQEMSQKIWKLIWEKVPLFLITLASCLVTFFVQRHGPAMQTLEQFPVTNRVANAMVSYATYLVKTIWPSGLAVYYPHPMDVLPSWQIVGAVSLLLVVSAVVFIERHRFPYLTVGWFWFLGTLVPVIGFVQVGGQAMADRYTYVPLIGLFIAGTWFGHQIITPRVKNRGVLFGLAAVGIIALSVCSRHQVSHWQNNISLFSHALDVTKDNQLAHNQIGLALSKEGRVEEGITHLIEAIRITPQYVSAHVNLGNAYKDQGDVARAAKHYRVALTFVPDHVTAKNNLGILLAKQGKMEEGMAHFSEVLEIDPENVRAHNNLGIALAKQGRLDEAIKHFSEALRIDPESESARKNIGQALQQKGR